MKLKEYKKSLKLLEKRFKHTLKLEGVNSSNLKKLKTLKRAINIVKSIIDRYEVISRNNDTLITLGDIHRLQGSLRTLEIENPNFLQTTLICNKGFI